MEPLGKRAAMDALAGRPAARVPFLLLTWGFDYMWKSAGIEPWQLACGSRGTWIDAYVATYERHKPDFVIFDSFGTCDEDPVLLDETSRSWIVRDGGGEEWEFIKSSFTLLHRPKNAGTPERVVSWNSRADVDANVPIGEFGDHRLSGLTDVIGALGDKALVMPTTIPGYIAACYTLGFDKSMQMMLDQPDLFMYLADRLSVHDEARMRAFAEAGAEAVFIADSWASCDIISPPMFRKFALPFQRKTVDAAKAAGLRAILWNLGHVGPILADEASLAIDAFAFEQPRKGFATSVAEAREAFGPDRCVFGNLDSEDLLRRNDAEEIRSEVHRQIIESGVGAPFVLSFGSPIPSDTAESAVDAVAQAVRDFSWA